MFIEILSACTVGSYDELLATNFKLPIKCVSLNIESCQARQKLIDRNSNETLFYPYTVSVSNFCGSCNIFIDSYAQFCVPNKVKIWF